MRHDRVAQALVTVAGSADAGGLRRMLHPGVQLTVDGGGVVTAPSRDLGGASEVGRYLAAVLFNPAASVRVASVNGMPGVVVCSGAAVTGVLGIRVRRGLIVQAWLVVNPDKLTRWSAE